MDTNTRNAAGKAVILCCLLLLAASHMPLCAKGKKDDIKAFFTESLRQETPSLLPATLHATVKPKDIARYTALVWQAWQEANAVQNEEKLIPLKSLCPKNSGVWHLPDSLEPSADMPYYWGIKWRALTTDEIQRNYKSGFKGDDSDTTDERIAQAAPLPMFIYLHGSGPKDDEWKYGLMWAQYFDDAPSVYFVPQIPNEGEYYRWWQRSKQYAWEKLLRLSLASGTVDANRLYVLGISEGGYGSQRLASFYADYLAAAGPMAGGEPLKNAPAENCANIGFSFLTGELDNGFYRNKLTGYTKEAFDSLQAAYAPTASAVGADTLFRHRIELMKGYGHGIDYTLTTPWLKTFVRNPYPKTVLWEDFPMDGRHRRGFYNLLVEERPADRNCYRMTIDGNVIRLTVDNVEYETTEKDPHWGIELKFRRHRKPAAKGRWRIYLNDSLVDMNRPVTVYLNGSKVFEGKVKATLQDMISSCREFFDPCRIYPASVEISL